MKKLSFVLCAIFFVSFAISQPTVYEQLLSVNNNWQHQIDVNGSLKTSYTQILSEQQLVKLHLQETEKLLRNRNTDNLSLEQKLQREKLLNILHNYTIEAKFPVNTLHQNRQPYFIDDFKTYCAVGYLMQQSGANEIALEINKSQNFNYLEDIIHPKLLKWVHQSGLSLEELALIQPSYGFDYPCYITEIHYNNIGVDVNEYIEILQPGSYSSIFGALSFDSVFFYNANDNIYKKLAKTQMQKGFNNNDTIFYYSLLDGDTMADIGKIELINTTANFPNSISIFRLQYSLDSVVSTSVNSSFIWNGFRKSFSTVENNTTNIGNSLNFCGTYLDRNATIASSTIGTINNCIITPVNLSNFNGKIIDNKVSLNWQTLTETNNNFFEIEKSSNGKNFESIGKIYSKKAAGINNYSFNDIKPNYLNHYRLKQIDKDGKFTYSKIVFIKLPFANPLTIGENPAKNFIQINISLENIKLKELILVDLFGKKIKTFKVIQGNQQINIQGIATGKYLLCLQNANGEIYKQQVIIVN